MNDKKDLCIVCAYRATCQKQFSLKTGRHCPDFARDLTLKEKDASEEGIKTSGS